MKLTDEISLGECLEQDFKLIDVEVTLKMLLTYGDLPEHQKKWVVKSYKNIINLRSKNE